MTVPIIPGPFSFLEEAGNAFEKIRTRRLTEARQHLNDMLGLVQAGGDVPVPSFVETAKRAGVPIDERGAAQLFEVAKRRARAALTTAEAGARRETGLATITGAQADVAGRTAEAGAQTAEAQARITGAEASAAPAHARLQQEIFEGATNLLGDPKNVVLRRVATYAAVGALPFLTQQLENQRQYSIELRNDARLLMQALQQVQVTYQTSLKEWTDQMTIEALKQNVDLSNEKEGAAFLSEYQKNFPRPDRNAIQTDVLSTFGLTPESFKEAAGTVFPRIFGQPEAQPEPGGRSRTKRKTVIGGPPPEEPRDQIQEAADILVQSPTKEVAKLMVDDFKAGGWTAMQMRAILARAKAAGYPDALIKAIETEIPE